MKFVQFTYKTSPKEIRAGYLEGDHIIDINKEDNSIPLTMVDILKGNHLGAVKVITSKKPSLIPLNTVRLEAPITNCDKVICVGLNYHDHCKEQNKTPPDVPVIFSKFSSCIIGPNQTVKIRTDVTDSVDYEIEFTVVIGKEASNVSANEAYDYVFGYTIAQDISARDWQDKKNAGQLILAKSMDTFCPLGPCIVTADEITEPQKLNVKCSINNELRQKSNTDQLIHKIPDIIARVSSVMTLYPGDIILTGTPGGVGWYQNPPNYLKAGDVITSEIENIGILTNYVENFH